MKKLYAILLVFCCSFMAANAQEPTNYKNYMSIVNGEIKAADNAISNLKKEIKSNPNDVELHKTMVQYNLQLEQLKAKKETVQNAEKLYKKLVDENKKFDEKKVMLLKLKEESEQADSNLVKIFRQK